ncbi:MAG: hypothetical protein HFE63_03630 [Clostridiales bacterium]|nr:hypothetical protein [Clostridiales bacterium]
MNTAMNQPELILPEHQNSSEKYRVFGYICRALIVFICTLGFAVFINDSLSLELSFAYQMLISTIAVLWFSIMGISKRFFFGGALAGAALLTYIAITVEDIADKLFYSAMSISNAFFRRLISLGYQNLQQNILNYNYSLRALSMTESECRRIAFGIIVFILAAVFSICILKKVRMIPLIIVGGAICTLVLYYGMNSGNFGFALIISALCGCAALAGYDHIYSRKKTIRTISGLDNISLPGKTKFARTELRHIYRTNSALGGFTGITAALIALVIMLLGPARVDKSMNDITAISTPLLKLENFILATINGQNPELSSLLFSGVSAIDSRSTAFENRRYSNTQLFEVWMDTSVPVYLRNWVGIDYYEDSWHSASYERIAEYKRMFGEDFSPELLTSELLWAMDPSYVELPEERNYRQHTDLGYVTALVNVKKLRGTANLLFMPSYSDQRTALLNYGTREQSRFKYSNYYDGLYTSTGYIFLDQYSTIANLPLLRDPDFAKNIENMMSRFWLNATIIAELRPLIDANVPQEQIDSEYIKLANQYKLFKTSANIDFNIKDNSIVIYFDTDREFDDYISEPSPAELDETQLAYRYVYTMTDNERERVDYVIENLTKYRDYVYDTYLSGCENISEIQVLARNIAYNNGMPYYLGGGSFESRHNMVMSVINYLSENMTYTLNPDKPSSSRKYSNAADSFLFDTQEGYCVQFATSAAMLIRSLGIPVRYAEGYIANSFIRGSGDNAVGRYHSTIRDRNAHAWIEVYYDYYGWIQYEATTPYYSDMYDNYTPANSELSFPEYDTPTDTAPNPPVETDTSYTPTVPTKPENRAVKIPYAVIIIAVCVAAAAVVLILISHRAKQSESRRYALLRSISDKTLDVDGRLSAAKRLDEGILYLLKQLKLTPLNGEQQSDFSVRVDNELKNISAIDFTNVSKAMLAGEFGKDITWKELTSISDYYVDLIAYINRGSNPIKRIWLKYFCLVKA